ncbi:Mitochondrial import inner membrane translocase subunit TIM50 [Quillaja saponaria]|uniref:Mitochondrial import inner membrane translocase subunit TIM50 n=2 Tax=Quillaja saponaria TaxID=32244 RepID=A0AAD7LMK5_QUISA|nr:Mitochondrial import inner membrane translocase subunit TIM50 [Quillaja saponaria]
MSSTILRSRVVSFISNCNRRSLCSNVVTNPPKEPLAAADTSVSPPTPPVAPIAEANSTKKGWSFFKYTLVGALTGATAASGYATYAYRLDEIDEKTKSLRESAKYSLGDDVTAIAKIQGFLYSTAMTVPAKAVELYLDTRRLIEEQIRSYTEPYSDTLLPDLLPQERHVFTLVLDLNETLIHYAWTRDTSWQTFKRPGVDAFLEHLAQFYEIIVYTDEQNMFVDPVIDRLDTKHCIRYRLSRPATKYQNGKHYRDLSKLNRDPAKVLYLSGHALESCLQPDNCVPIKAWQQQDKDDTALVDFIPFLEFVARTSPSDIRPVLASYQGCEIPTEFIRRSKEHQRRMQGQKQRLWRH